VTAEQAAADRRVINAAKQIERASQYGTNASNARAAYDQARAEQAELRGERAA
jgi:hypothetical protein